MQSLTLIAGPSMIVTMLLDETRPASRECHEHLLKQIIRHITDHSNQLF